MWEGVSGCGRVCLDVGGGVWMWEGVSGCEKGVWMWDGVPGYGRGCLDVGGVSGCGMDMGGVSGCRRGYLDVYDSLVWGCVQLILGF